MTIDLSFEQPTEEYVEELMYYTEKFKIYKNTMSAGTMIYALMGIYTPISDVLKYASKIINYENLQAVNHIQTMEHIIFGSFSVIGAIAFLFANKNFRKGVKEWDDICEHFEVRKRLGAGYALNKLR